jgi:hypothetical protein
MPIREIMRAVITTAATERRIELFMIVNLLTNITKLKSFRSNLAEAF